MGDSYQPRSPDDVEDASAALGQRAQAASIAYLMLVFALEDSDEHGGRKKILER